MSDSLSISKYQLPPLEKPSLPSLTANEQFLRFYLEPDTTALLPIQELIEVLTVPVGQIVPIAYLPAWVMGVYNWRGEILWMVDLGHLLGLTPWYQQEISASTHRAVVLQVCDSDNINNQMLGLVVNRVEDIEWCNPDVIKSPASSTLTPELEPFLRGYTLKSNGEMLLLLDGEAILSSMPK
ncbi:purine-binding chemotaxis protein CheW [Coleofasciculus sp. LEGE 07081]|nr:chemotaxis protein CheW [Coleofasciculus sp. LEGE 07081]MBE9127853.1 purine-binding chemotaxis protein CheW [Coleofasciculus sp. LEGE 07081]